MSKNVIFCYTYIIDSKNLQKIYSPMVCFKDVIYLYKNARQQFLVCIIK